MIGQPICSWACMEARHDECAGGGCVCRCHVTVAEKLGGT